MINIHTCTEKLDRIESAKLTLVASRITFLRPQVSERNPQKWELITTPQNAAPLSIPLSEKVNCRSHSAAEIIKPILSVSLMTLIKQNPQTNSRKVWNFPSPINSNASL